jgi:hypothetical protein
MAAAEHRYLATNDPSNAGLSLADRGVLSFEKRVCAFDGNALHSGHARAYDALKRPCRHSGGGRKFTSQVAEIATTCAGSVRLWIRVNNSYNLRAGVTQNSARTVLLPTFL